MLRAADLELLVLSTSTSLAVVGGWRLWSGRTTVSLAAVLAAAAATVAVAVVSGSTLETGARDVPGVHWLLGTLVAVVAVVGAARTRRADPNGRTVVALVLVSLVGVWAAVPETSYVLAAAGCVIAVAVLVASPSTRLGTGAAGAIAVLPVVAGTLGADGDRHAAVGSWLCALTLALLAVVPLRAPPPPMALLAGTVAATGSAMVAARHVAIDSSWDGVWVPVAACVALASLSVALLRQAHR